MHTLLHSFIFVWILYALLYAPSKSFRIPLWALTATLHTVLSLVGALLGIVIVKSESYEKRLSKVNGKMLWQWKPAWAWPWGNEEDGITQEAVPTVAGIFAWSGARNKVSNLRFTKLLGFTVDPSKVGSVYGKNSRNLYLPLTAGQKLFWSIAWQGIYAGIWVKTPWRQFRAGWAIVPADADGYNPLDLRQKYCGFSIQLNKG
jgi:hypothetical protein